MIHRNIYMIAKMQMSARGTKEVDDSYPWGGINEFSLLSREHTDNSKQKVLITVTASLETVCCFGNNAACRGDQGIA